MGDMIDKDEAALAIANVEIGYHDGIGGDWHPLSGPAIISAACAVIRALPPAPDAVEALVGLLKEVLTDARVSADLEARIAAALRAGGKP